MNIRRSPNAYGRIQASVAGPCFHNQHTGPWLLRVKKPSWHKGQAIFVKEANLVKVFKNVGRFVYLDGMQVSVDLNSDRLLGTLSKSTGIVGPIPIDCIDTKTVISWNAYADFKLWKEERQTFEGVNLEAITVYDTRPGATTNSISYPKYPRFAVGDVVLTKYELYEADPGINYGYARVDRISEEFEPLGVDKVSLVSYTIRRSWKDISVEDWNRFSRLKDYLKEGKMSMQKLPTSVQSRVRQQLFDPFYR